MLTELKETVFKGLKTDKTTTHQIENINREKLF